MTATFATLFAGKAVLVVGGHVRHRRGHRGRLCALGAVGHRDGALRGGVRRLDVIVRSRADVRDDAAMARVVGDMPRLDVLVNCAGIIRRGAEHDIAVFETVLAINLAGTMRACTLARPKLAASQGAIVNTASMLSFFGGGLVPGYSASKGGVAQLTKSLAIAYASDGIRVNAIAPGWVDDTAHPGRCATIPQRNAAILARTPARTMGAARGHRGRRGLPVLARRAVHHRRRAARRRRLPGRLADVHRAQPSRRRRRCPSVPRFAISRRATGRKAHPIVQEDDTELGCWAHGIVHMLEGDMANARYWYRRAHRVFPKDADAQARRSRRSPSP